MSDDNETFYACVGVCMADPDSGVCLGCGRPLIDVANVVVEAVPVPAQRPAPTTDEAPSDA